MTSESLENAQESQGTRCYRCGKQLTRKIHRIPIRQGRYREYARAKG